MSARILIIEDDRPSRELVRYLLESAGYVAFEAGDGEAGAGMTLELNPDLIICDLQMPVLNGYEVAKRLHETPQWRRVPLIAVTALSMSGDRDKALAAGFDDHITKPIVPETFVGQIETYLPLELRANGPATN